MDFNQFEEPIYPPLEWELPAQRTALLAWRERFPVSRERRQSSAGALHALREEHPDRVEGRSFPWRARLLTATGLPAMLRTWADAPFARDDDQGQEMAQRLLSTGLRSQALFGETKSGGFDGEAREFVATPVIKVWAGVAEAGAPLMRHFAWRQEYRGLPVLGGGVRVHEVTHDRRICLTSSYFPIEDAPPNLDANSYKSAVECVWIALLALLSAPEVNPAAVLAIMVERFVQERRSREAADFLAFLQRSKVDWLVYEALDLWHAPAVGFNAETAVEALGRIRDHLRQRLAADYAHLWAQVAPIHGHDLAILPFAASYLLVQRVEVGLADADLWYVDIDVHSGDVLGGPWQAVVHAPSFVRTSGEALQGMASGDAAGLDAGRLGDYVILNDGLGNVVNLSQPLPITLGQEAATIAYYGAHLLEHLEERCGAILPSPPPSQVFVHVNSGGSTGFIYGTAGKSLRFQRDLGNLQEDGKRVVHPGRDPELVMHEFAHAFLHLLNDDPWDTLSTWTPFGRALQEGYATYLARSLADQDGDSADQRWARGAYRPQDWGSRWQLGRSGQQVGADLLPAPNVYPVGEYSILRSLEDYDVGMVWARALWDLRTVVGAQAADRLAIRAYPYLHGYLTSYELAAEALINADAQVSELDLTNGTQPLWAARGIAAGQGVYGFARAQNGLLIAAGEAGILRSGDGGASWAPEVNNLAGGGSLTGVVAVAADGDHLYAIAELPPPQAVGSHPQWNPGIYWRNAGQANSLWQEIPGWPNDVTPLCLLQVGPGQLLVGSNRGVYALSRDPANNHTCSAPHDTRFAALALVTTSTATGTIACAADPVKLIRNGLNNVTSSMWNFSDKLFDNANETRITALVGRGSDLFVGLIPPPAPNQQTLFQLNLISGNWSKTAIGNVRDPVLTIAGDAARLWVATPTNVLEWNGAALTARGLPVPEARVLSLAATATHLLAGTLAHGIWRLPLGGGSWQPAWAPPALASLDLPAGGAALFSFTLEADQPAFVLNTVPGVAVQAVFQVGFPPALVPPQNNGATYNLQAGAVIVAVRNLANQARTLQLNWVGSRQLGLS